MTTSAPVSSSALPPAERFVEVPLRPAFYESSAFFPMPILLLGTRDVDGAANLAPYSHCFPSLAQAGHRMELVARAATKTARFLVRTGRVTLNFIPDRPDYLACCRALAAPIPTKEKMEKSIFTCFDSTRGPGLDGTAGPPLVAEAVQIFECRLLEVHPFGEEEQRFVLEVESIRMQRYWAQMLETGRSGPRLPVDYGFRSGSHSWMSRPELAASGPRLRPEFIVELDRPPEQVLSDFRAALQQPDVPVSGRIIGDLVKLDIPPEEVTTWSPSMELAIQPGPQGSCVAVRIGPKPTIWTTFMFLHLLIACLGLGGLMYGASLWFVHQQVSSWLWVPLAALFLHAFVAGAAFVGQGLGSDQVYRLRSFASDVLGP